MDSMYLVDEGKTEPLQSMEVKGITVLSNQTSFSTMRHRPHRYVKKHRNEKSATANLVSL